MKKSFAYPIIFMALLTGMFTFILAFLNESTAERVALLQETDLRLKVLYAFNIEVTTEDATEIEKLFNEKIEEEVVEDTTIFIAKENGEEVGYAFPVSGPGLWGTINAYAAITPDYNQLLGIAFIKHDETPGLGGRIEEEIYLEQFQSLDLTTSTGGVYVVYNPAPNGNIDAIAGATLTSNAVAKLLNEDIDSFIQARRGN